MNTNPMIESYIAEMENLIVCVLGEATEMDLARLSGLSQDKVKTLKQTREMVKLNHLIKERKHSDLNSATRNKYFHNCVEQKEVVNA